MSHFIRCDRCNLEEYVMGTVSMPPGWAKICDADLCEWCSKVVRDFIRFKPSDAQRLPVEPIPATAVRTDGKLFETAPEEEPCVTPADSTAVPMTDSQDAAAIGAPTPPVGMTRTTKTNTETGTTTSSSQPPLDASTEERARTRKTRKKLAGVDAILPDKRIPAEPGAPIL
jgi:hypothetical protein